MRGEGDERVIERREKERAREFRGIREFRIVTIDLPYIDIDPEAVVPLAATTNIEEFELIRFDRLSKEAL